jgi:hypothetical protein
MMTNQRPIIVRSGVHLVPYAVIQNQANTRLPIQSAPRGTSGLNGSNVPVTLGVAIRNPMQRKPQA